MSILNMRLGLVVTPARTYCWQLNKVSTHVTSVTYLP